MQQSNNCVCIADVTKYNSAQKHVKDKIHKMTESISVTLSKT